MKTKWKNTNQKYTLTAPTINLVDNDDQKDDGGDDEDSTEALANSSFLSQNSEMSTPKKGEVFFLCVCKK